VRKGDKLILHRRPMELQSELIWQYDDFSKMSV